MYIIFSERSGKCCKQNANREPSYIYNIILYSALECIAAAAVFVRTGVSVDSIYHTCYMYLGISTFASQSLSSPCGFWTYIVVSFKLIVSVNHSRRDDRIYYNNIFEFSLPARPPPSNCFCAYDRVNGNNIKYYSALIRIMCYIMYILCWPFSISKCKMYYSKPCTTDVHGRSTWVLYECLRSIINFAHA